MRRVQRNSLLPDTHAHTYTYKHTRKQICGYMYVALCTVCPIWCGVGQEGERVAVTQHIVGNVVPLSHAV